MKFSSGKKVRPFSLRHPYLLPTILIVGFVFTMLTAYVAFSGETVGAKDTRIVKLVVDGETQVLATRSKYVSDLVKALGLTLSAKDKVDPGLDTPIIEDNQTITIYRARPVVVAEGKTRKELITAEYEPSVVANEAGFAVDDKDLVIGRPYDEALANGIAAEKFEVFRAIPITANVYGTVANYRTQSKTVGEFLRENNIQLKDGETIQPENQDEKVTPNMLISINVKGKKTLAVTEQIPFRVETKNDPKLQAGQTKLGQAGVPGEKAVIYELTYEGDREVGRREIQTIVTREPVQEIRIRGSLAASSYNVSAEKVSLMAAAGIGADQYGAVDFIINKESRWRPGAINANGCIGLGQRCPSRGTNALANACPNWQTDPVCQLQHFSAYANGRYGSWNGAYAAWVAQGWW